MDEKLKEKHDNDTSFFETNKSIAVITMSGFAGALAGLSISRSRVRSAMAIGKTYTQVANLPLVFALSTATFASIIEYSSVLSPTNFLVKNFIGTDMLQLPKEIEDFADAAGWNTKCSTTLGDYAIGGAMAGAIFSGSANRALENRLNNPQEVKKTTVNIVVDSAAEKQKSLIGKGKVITLASKNNKKKIVPIKSAPTLKNEPAKVKASKIISRTNPLGSNPSPRPRIMGGLTTGLVLGLGAGIVQILISKLEDYASSQSNINVNEGEKQVQWTQEQEEELDAKIKSMSTEEIRQEIEKLRKNIK